MFTLLYFTLVSECLKEIIITLLINMNNEFCNNFVDTVYDRN